jgi:hypothetical protein
MDDDTAVVVKHFWEHQHAENMGFTEIHENTVSCMTQHSFIGGNGGN